ncbi:MAG: winged helix-turn-helix domain-containing protein [Pseudomonadota bacterium]
MAHAKARMRALSERPRFRIADELEIHPERLIVARGDEEIKLQLRTMEALVVLAENCGETVAKERLMISVWRTCIYDTCLVSKTISRLRKYIDDDARNPRFIETIHKIGFRMIAPVTWPEHDRRFTTSNG